VDSEGNIYLSNLRAPDNCIFVFDKEGGFLYSFGKRGEGPGELQNPLHMAVSDRDEICVTDRGKLTTFSRTGEFISSLRVDMEYMRIIPLNKERFLTIAVKMNEDLSQSFQAVLCSSEMEEIKTLDSAKIDSFAGSSKVNIIPTLLHWETSEKYIFTGNTENYEIRVFDFDGNLIRKIRKDHKPLPLAAADKERYKQQIQKYPPEIKDKFFIPEDYPPFRNITAMIENRLFVRTYEISDEGAFIYDVYNPDGIFTHRAKIEGVPIKFFGDKIYCLKEKTSGFKELVVYRIQ
jgi:hypothetical protein